MAEQAEGDTIFVYLGGEQEVPAGVTRVRIDRSVKIIPEWAFINRRELLSVETHGGIEKIEVCAFNGCESLRGIKFPGVREIGNGAFIGCEQLTDAEFGDKLETIERDAFGNCENLQRIAIPLKDNLFPPLNRYFQRYTQLDDCENLTTVDIVGVEGIHNTISSLFLESWKDEMNEEIDRINLVLPNTPADEKTNEIRLWIRSVINRMEHYKAEHYELLKEDMTQLELAVWKAKLEEDEEDDSNLKVQAKKAMIDMENARKERRITSGADIIISNVLPFLQLLE